MGESLNHDLAFMTFLIGVAHGVGGEWTDSDQTLFFAGDRNVRWCCHGALSLLEKTYLKGTIA